MNKKNALIVIISIIIGVAVGYKLSPTRTITKVEEKIIYKDKIINEVRTIVKYKDGTEKTVIITKTEVKETEKVKIKQKTTIKHDKFEVAPFFGYSWNGDKLGGLLVYTPLFLNISWGAGFQVNFDKQMPSAIISLKMRF